MRAEAAVAHASGRQINRDGDAQAERPAIQPCGGQNVTLFLLLFLLQFVSTGYM